MAVHASTSLYVGDLHPEVNEATLFDIFNNVGPVASVHVCRDLQTRRSLGYGYVNFTNPQDAEASIERLNFTSVFDRPMRVMWSQRDPSLRKSGVGNVFVKNLEKDLDNKTLFDTFSRFGNILSCKIMTDEHGASKGYAYIHYDTPDAADKAIAEATGMLLGGKGEPLVVQRFQRRTDRVGSQFTNVYFKNFDRDTVTEKDLRELLSQYGEVTSLYVPTDPEGKVKGFGFANFKDPNSAQKVIDDMHNKEWKGRTLYLQRAQSKKERDMLLRQQREQRRLERQRRFQGLNLYVKNVDDAVDDAQLMQAFAAYGNITSAKIMRDETGRSKGFGFVCFSTPEEATKAMNEMHNKVLGAKPIYVAMHQPREQRRAYLEQVRTLRMPMRAAGMPGPYQAGMFQPAMYPPMPGGRFVPGQFPPYPMGGRPVWRGQPPAGAPGAGARPPMGPGGQPGFAPMGPGAYGGPRPSGPRPQRGPRPQQPGAPQPQGGAPGAGAPAGARGIQYRASARNVGAGQEAAVPAAAPQTAAPQATISASEPLTAAAIASLDPTMQKQVLGERLYPLVMATEPQLGPKITGMLLQMEVPDILHLMESRDVLNESIREALEVLRQSGYGADDTQATA